MASYRLSREAEKDLIRIHQYGVRTFGEQQADLYFHALVKQFDLIAKNPYHYQAVDYIKPGYRHCVYKADTIYFRITDINVEIMAIIGRQDLDESLL